MELTDITIDIRSTDDLLTVSQSPAKGTQAHRRHFVLAGPLTRTFDRANGHFSKPTCNMELRGHIKIPSL